MRICVFCGSNEGTDPAFRAGAEALGRALAAAGAGLVYGGGRVGLMGVIADAALEKGGEVIGVIPEDLLRKEVGHMGLKDLRIVPSMHARKALMEQLSDGFVAMPGGFGTLDELCEILTWAQLGLHQKPIGLLNVGGYFDGFLEFLGTAVQRGFIRAEHRAMLHDAKTPEELLAAFAAWKPRPATKWIKAG